MNNQIFSLAGKTIVVTGASSGIGRACAILCAQQGARLLLIGRNVERLQETVDQAENGQQHQTLQVDLCDYESVEEQMKQLLPQLGNIHGLVNCAGISTTLPFNSVRTEKMRHFFETNVFATLHLTRLLLKSKRFEKAGSVVFISSVMGVVGSAGKSLYSMTKGALISASRSLALEYAPKKIRFNCISPGVVETPMSQKAVYSRSEQALNQIKALHPLGLGNANDVAQSCIFLLSDASSWITGINLVVDGGYTAR
ncbi:MAG: SDR family oxidoreductase [Carboxylicivirga sp.]|jgi:NAD(P)-dependent dehydrogenase (short-subunit alcohol dehydrogenase family)|nr:SDR family oxidoreductase [Carboxylicivirga sp.]